MNQIRLARVMIRGIASPASKLSSQSRHIGTGPAGTEAQKDTAKTHPEVKARDASQSVAEDEEDLCKQQDTSAENKTSEKAKGSAAKDDGTAGKALRNAKRESNWPASLFSMVQHNETINFKDYTSSPSEVSIHRDILKVEHTTPLSLTILDHIHAVKQKATFAAQIQAKVGEVDGLDTAPLSPAATATASPTAATFGSPMKLTNDPKSGVTVNSAKVVASVPPIAHAGSSPNAKGKVLAAASTKKAKAGHGKRSGRSKGAKAKSVAAPVGVKKGRSTIYTRIGELRNYYRWAWLAGKHFTLSPSSANGEWPKKLLAANVLKLCRHVGINPGLYSAIQIENIVDRPYAFMIVLMLKDGSTGEVFSQFYSHGKTYTYQVKKNDQVVKINLPAVRKVIHSESSDVTTDPLSSIPIKEIVTHMLGMNRVLAQKAGFIHKGKALADIKTKNWIPRGDYVRINLHHPEIAKIFTGLLNNGPKTGVITGESKSAGKGLGRGKGNIGAIGGDKPASTAKQFRAGGGKRGKNGKGGNCGGDNGGEGGHF